jgi:hypothetical protein
MTDPIALSASADVAVSSAPAQLRTPLDPADTRMFASLMGQGGAVPPAEVSGGPNALRDAAMHFAEQFSAKGRSLEEMRSTMLASVDPNDPVKTMFAMTDLSMQAHATFSKLHIASGLASAATSLFGTLLKNQQ